MREEHFIQRNTIYPSYIRVVGWVGSLLFFVVWAELFVRLSVCSFLLLFVGVFVCLFVCLCWVFVIGFLLFLGVYVWCVCVCGGGGGRVECVCFGGVRVCMCVPFGL